MKVIREDYGEVSYLVTIENDQICFYYEAGNDYLIEEDCIEEFLVFHTTLSDFNKKFMVSFNSIEEFEKGLNSLNESDIKDFLFHLPPTPIEEENLCFLLKPIQKMQGSVYKGNIDFDTKKLDGEKFNQSTKVSYNDSLIFFTIGFINIYKQLVISTFGFTPRFLSQFFNTNSELDAEFLKLINTTILSQKINDYYFDYDIDNRPELCKKLKAYLRKRKIKKLFS